MPEVETRKAYRQAQKAKAKEDKLRDQKRVQVEKEYAEHNHTQAPKTKGRFDEGTYTKVNSLKKKLNWAIGIEIFLLAVVAAVLFLL